MTCRISMHPFLHEVIAGFDQPSFGKCHEFINRLENEYIASVEDEINFADLINLTKSIFRSIQVDDTVMAFQFITKVCRYLESYVFYNTMRGMLDIMKEIIPLDEDHKIEMAVYQFYQGVIDCGKDDWDAAKEHFDCAVEYLEPVNGETVELAIDFYSNLYMNCFLEEIWKSIKSIKSMWIGQLPYGRNMDLRILLRMSMIKRNNRYRSK